MNIETMKGNTEECLRHFFDKNPGLHESLKELVDVNDDVFLTWQKGENLPTGVCLVKIRYFLHFIGYNIKDILELSQPLFFVGQCIFFGLVSDKEVIEELKLLDRSSFFRYFRYGAKEGISEKRLKILQEIADRYSDVLPGEIAEFKHKIGLGEGVKPLPKKQSVDHRTPASKVGDKELTDDELINGFRSACKEVREFGQKLLDGPVELRKKLRMTMTQPGVAEIHRTFDIIHALMKGKTGV